jgi:hypothetical protein
MIVTKKTGTCLVQVKIRAIKKQKAITRTKIFTVVTSATTTTVAPTSTTTAATTTTTIAVASCATGGVCALGDTGPGGGKVFYVASTPFSSTGSTCNTTCKYLEAATADIAGTHRWCSNTSSSLGVTATGIGSGMPNTTTADGVCISGAIQLAADYSNNGKTDWHLPSKDELDELYLNKASFSGFSSAFYWSSSETGTNTAWGQYFLNGNQAPEGGKLSEIYVRPVRAF